VTDITTTTISLGWEPPESDGSNDVMQYNIDMREEHEADYSSLAKVSLIARLFVCFARRIQVQPDMIIISDGSRGMRWCIPHWHTAVFAREIWGILVQ